MTEPWYETTVGVPKPPGPFSFDECMGLMIDTVQAYGQELVNQRNNTAAIKNMMHVLEINMLGEVEEESPPELQPEEIPISDFVGNAQEIAKKMYRPPLTFEAHPAPSVLVDNLKAHIASAPVSPSQSIDSKENINESTSTITRQEFEQMQKMIQEMSMQIQDQSRQLAEQALQASSSSVAISSDSENESAEKRELMILKLQSQQDMNEKQNNETKLLLGNLKKEISSITNEIEILRTKSMTPAPTMIMPPVIEEEEEEETTTKDSKEEKEKGGGGMSKQETQHIVLDVMQANVQNMIQQASQVAETTAALAVNSGLKSLQVEIEETRNIADQALNQVEEMKEKDKAAALMSSRDRVAAKNAAKAAAKAEAAAKKAEKAAAEAGDKSYADLEDMKSSLKKYRSDIDNCDREIEIIKSELTKTNFMRAVAAVATPQSSRPGTADPAAALKEEMNSSEAFKNVNDASGKVDLPNETGKKAIDLISAELWKIRQEVLQLAKKSSEDIEQAVISLDEKNKHTILKSSENSTRAAEEAIANWKAEQGEETEEQIMALINDVISNKTGGGGDSHQIPKFNKASSLNDDSLFAANYAATKPRSLTMDDEGGTPKSSKSSKFTFAKAVNTVVVEERKKRKSFLKGKPDLSNTLMDRIETLETQMKQMEDADTLHLVNQMGAQLDNFKAHILGMLNETNKIPEIREDVDVLQVTTEQLVTTSEKKIDPEAMMELMKQALDEDLNKINKRLNGLEDVGNLMTDFSHNDDDSDDEEMRKKQSNSFLPPKHVALKEVMRSLRDSTEHGHRRPGDFIWADEGAIDKMKKDIHWLRKNLANGLSSLQFKLQLHSDFIGDFEEIRGFAPITDESKDIDEMEAKDEDNDIAESKDDSKSSEDKLPNTNVEEVKSTIEEGEVDVVEAARLKQLKANVDDSDDDSDDEEEGEDGEDGEKKLKKKKIKKSRKHRKVTLKARLETLQNALKALQTEGSEYSATQSQQKLAVRSLVENILTLQDDMGDAKEKLSSLEGGKEMKQELHRVAEQMAELFDTSSGIAQSMSTKADNLAVNSIMEQLTDYSKRSADELSKLAGASDAKIREAQEEMKRQLAHELEQALMNLPKGGESNALLRGHCLSCNQTIPRAKPRFPRLLVNPHAREDSDTGAKMPFQDEGSYLSIDPSIESMSSQISHAEKVDVMGGGFRLHPQERYQDNGGNLNHQNNHSNSSNSSSSKLHTTMKPMMMKKTNGTGIAMKQKLQREGIGRLQPMLPVPNNKPMELDFSNNAPPPQPQGLPNGVGVAPFARKLMPWEKEGDPMNTADSSLVEKQRKGKSQQYPTR